MPSYNDLDLSGENRKNYEDILTDSLWIINERDKSGKHSNYYHGNFIPQIPNQLIRRYTKIDDRVIDPFLGSATTAIEGEKLQRNVIGIDIQQELITKAEVLMEGTVKHKFICGDSADKETYNVLKTKEFAQLLLLHPPYHDIIKFTDMEGDLSNMGSVDFFLDKFGDVVENALQYIKKGGYIGLVIGDMYRDSERISLGFMCAEVCKSLGLKQKSIIIKNIEGNRGKLGSGGIWRYRALQYYHNKQKSCNFTFG